MRNRNSNGLPAVVHLLLARSMVGRVMTTLPWCGLTPGFRRAPLLARRSESRCSVARACEPYCLDRLQMTASSQPPTATLVGDSGTSFDYPVGAQQNRLRDRESERLCSLDIYREIESHGLFDR